LNLIVVLATIILMLVTAPTPAHAFLVGLSTRTDDVYNINPTTGRASFLSNSGADYAGVGLAFVRGRLYASDAMLHMGEPWDVKTALVDIVNGKSSPLFSQDSSENWPGLAGNDAEGVLYSIGIEDSILKRIDVTTGIVTSVGTGTGIDGRGMEYDNVNRVLYATNSQDNCLYRVNTSTGVATKIGNLGISATFIGLAMDQNTGVLYANQIAYDSSQTPQVTTGIGNLYEINKSTGSARLIGSNDAEFIDGLAWLNEAPNLSNIKVGSSVSAIPLPSVTTTFDHVTNGGSVTAVLNPSTPATPANFRVLTGASYLISTTATFSGNVIVSIKYTESTLANKNNESRIRLFHHNGQNGAWGSSLESC
jgi:hypothetical protein